MLLAVLVEVPDVRKVSVADRAEGFGREASQSEVYGQHFPIAGKDSGILIGNILGVADCLPLFAWNEGLQVRRRQEST
jgi:hypothetical protein